MTGEMKRVMYFTGIVAYQRLKHLVADKVHARSLGPVDPETRQPVQGRSRDGGLRMGEMENWGVLAHGASQVLRERLLLSSDGVNVHICNECGLVAKTPNTCSDRTCPSISFKLQMLPFSFLVLIDELRAMGIDFRH
jgi:DNA-directed RNA polymerase III subunit RPC2